MTEDREALLYNALHNVDSMRSVIHDALTRKNDLMLKVSLLQDLDDIELMVRRAL